MRGDRDSLSAVGIYQSTGLLCSIYVGVVLESMGANFYPGLTTAAHDNSEVNRAANEQIEIGLLLASPGVPATQAFVPLVIHLF